ncbi:hypothetical protein NDA01_25485 [Trichocoleus desertorum AS-A10]|uniref:VMAP-C domain-containing protein n=1 Tax=Trichocoleus desertorum TaxID=1481672 RepID=UPI00329A1D73
MSKDYLLDHYQTQLDDLEQDYEQVKEQLRVELDAPTQNRLERQIEQIGRKTRELQQKIEQHKAERQRQLAQDALAELIGIFKAHAGQLDLLVEAYQQTIRHWSVPVDLNARTVDAIINELERIAPGQLSYTAREEFIAHVVQKTSSPPLAHALNQWGDQYRMGIDWLQLHDQIQAIQNNRLENAQPAIFITITRCDEDSTQAQEDQPYYRLNAWLIENLETYRSQKTGYQSLLPVNSLDSAPCLLDELLQRMTRLVNQFLIQQRQVCERCQNYPEIHVFLPLELMYLGADAWLLEPETGRRRECLGHDHVVVIRCANRYDRAYNKGPSWLRLWQRHQSLLEEPADNVFVLGHDYDLDELMDVLDEAVQPDSKIVGLRVKHPPVNTEELCYELLDSGLPLAIWARTSLVNQCHESELSNLLTTCCLGRLPYTVKGKRHETRRRQNSPDCHIGHHLSLLWDDPYLVPPKSA